jgi:thymidylate kinase
MIVAVEGLDGSGKTTVAHALAEMLDAAYIAVPPPEMRLVVDGVLERHDSIARYLYYLAGVASLIEAAERRDLVVADRFIASAHALHVHVQGDIASSLRRLAFPCADLSFYLHVSEDERRKRLARRGVPLDPFEIKLNEDDSFRLEVATCLQACPGTYVIDTTGLQPSVVAEQARDVWRAALRWGHSKAGGRQWLC